MKLHWKALVLTAALTSISAVHAIEGPSNDRDTSRGPTWDRESRFYEERGGSHYQSDNMRARNQEARDDRAERRMARDFDVQGRMNN